jgi:hypothetical protein
MGDSPTTRRIDLDDGDAIDRGDGVETDGGAETVWVVSNAGGQGDVYHATPDCRNIKAESTVLAKPRSIVGELDRCQTADCWGEHANDHGSRDHYHAALESDPDEVAPEPDDRLITDGGSDDVLPDGGRETPPGIYLLNATGEMAPLATEDGGDTDLLYEALDEHVESQRPLQERLAEINEDLRDSDNIGEAILVGDFGLHTFYDPDRTDYGVGTQTLLLEAFRQATEEIWLDEEIVRDNQGEVSPESVAAETVDQIHDLIGQSHFFNRYRRKLVEILRQADERHEWTDGDRDDDSGLVTDGGNQVDACPHCDSSRVRRSRDDRTPAAERWTCYACRERFGDDEVITRSPRASGSGPASELSALEPDDLVTDGGRPPATCTHCGEEFPPDGECPAGGGHDFVAFDGGQPTDRPPIAQFDDAVCFYYEAAAANPVRPPEHPDDAIPSPTRHEGSVAIYDGWVRLGGPIPNWVPREAVEAVHER